MAGFLSKLLTLGEGRQMKNYEADRGADQRPRIRDAGEKRRGAAGAHRGVPRPRRGGGGPQGHPARGVCRQCARRRCARWGCATSTCSSSAHGLKRRADRRDEDRRGQDARVHAGRLLERASRQQRAHRHRQRLPWPAATASGWAASTVSLGMEVGLIQNGMRPDKRKPATPPTSPTAPTPSSLRLPARQHGHARGGPRASAVTTSPSWTRWTPSSSTRRARRSSSRARARRRPRRTTSSPASCPA